MAGTGGTTRLLEMVRERALKRGEFVLSSGQKSDYYLDGKQVTLDGEGALLVAEAVLERIRDDAVDAVGGLTLGADPMAGAVVAVAASTGRKLRGFLVRKDLKGHGTAKRVEGPVTAGARCVVLEDVCSTGASALKAVDALAEMGCKVVRVVSIVDREMGAVELFREKQIPYSPIFTKTEVLG